MIDLIFHLSKTFKINVSPYKCKSLFNTGLFILTVQVVKIS